jgi:hypothetical protein
VSDFEDMKNTILNSKGWHVENVIETLITYFRIFHGNYVDLKEMIDQFGADQSIALWDENNRQQLQDICIEATRLLYNFVNAAKSLVEHTRKLMDDEFGDTSFRAQYQQEVNTRFASNLLAAFVEDLRNYSVHYSFPLANAALNLKRLSEQENSFALEMRLTVAKDRLLNWKKLSSRSKTFLSGYNADVVPLDALVVPYYEQVLLLHQWTHENLRKIHAVDLDALEKMRQIYRDQLGKFPD